MIENELILNKIVEGIQEKKGKKITIIDMTDLQDAPCSYFVIAEGDSKTHVNALSSSVNEYVRDNMKIKPYATDGTDNGEWVAMDYGHIIVHIFQRMIREFYDIEHLWEDAKIIEIEDLD